MGMLSTLQLGTKRPLRVAAYCRVSTEEEMQQNSYENQREFFQKEIREHPDWVLASIYGDRARSGTSVVRRLGFQRMMRQAEAGTIDYIITKSISRFSRSTTDTIRTLQKLKQLGVGVYFMEESIDSLSNIGHIVIDTMATIAEMESASISENIRTALDAANQQGWPMRRAAYGYDKKGRYWEINKLESVRVKLAFLMVSEGYSFAETMKRLNQFEEKDNTGKIWTYKMVRNLLQNEVYIGDILTNKSVNIWDGTQKKNVVNDNLVDQYYVKHHHEALVSLAVFEKVNELVDAKRLAGERNFKGKQSLMELTMLAKRDKNLNSVRKYLPYSKGKYMMA